jgi:hypothetical protein
MPSDPTDTERTRTFEVTCRDLCHAAWSNEEIAAMERESLEAWQHIPEDDRRGMAVIMRDCLIRMLEAPLEWLPTSIKPETGSRIGIYVAINLDDVTEEVLRMRERAELELTNQIHNIAGLRDELGADDSGGSQ